MRLEILDTEKIRLKLTVISKFYRLKITLFNMEYSAKYITCVGWHVTLCDLIWQVTSLSFEVYTHNDYIV